MLNALALFFASPRGLKYYWKTHYASPVLHQFTQDYRWNAFDISMLVPYFIVMVILAFYGIHRYQLVWLYYRNRRKEARSSEPPARYAETDLPFVTIQLPIYNEQFVIDRLLDACCRLDYPRDRFEVQLLDDSTDETISVASAIVARYAAGTEGLAPQPVHYIHRTNRRGYKAGALEEGLRVAKGDLIAIFDADFVPPPSWLRQVVHHFAEPGVGMVQTRWTHLNRNYSFLTQVEAILLDGHFVLEHGGRSRAGVFFNFNGTAGMWRREAIAEAGGWQHDTLTEDTDLSYRAQLKGWKFKYLQDVECPAELPIEMTAFKTQQARWAKGLIQTGKKILPSVMRSRCALPHQARGLVSPDGEHQLSADDRPLRAADAGDDHSLLARAPTDAAHRSAALYGLHDVRLDVLPGQPEGALSAHLVQDLPLCAVPDGARRGPDHHQHQGGAGGTLRHQERVRAHAEVSPCRRRARSRRPANTASASELSPGSS